MKFYAFFRDEALSALGKGWKSSPLPQRVSTHSSLCTVDSKTCLFYEKRRTVHYESVYNCDNKSQNSNLLFFLNMSLCSCTQMYLIRHSGRQARRLSGKQAFHWKFVLTHRCRTLVSVVVSGDFCRFKLSFPSLLFLSKDF